MADRRKLVAAARKRIRDGFTRDVGTKLLALVFALAIWAWVQTERVVDRRVRVRVDYNWDEELVAVDEVRGSLVVTVSGPQGLVRTLDRKSLRVPIDMPVAFFAKRQSRTVMRLARTQKKKPLLSFPSPQQSTNRALVLPAPGCSPLPLFPSKRQSPMRTSRHIWKLSPSPR